MFTKKNILFISIAGNIVCIYLFSHYIKSNYVFNLWYQDNFYPVISSYLRLIWGWLPFSAGDIFYFFLLIYTIFTFLKIFRGLFNRKWNTVFFSLLKVLNIYLILYCVFLIFWAGNYHRKSFTSQIDLPSKKINTSQLVELSKLIIDSVNQNINQWHEKPLNQLQNEAFNLYLSNPLSTYKNKSFKKSVFSPIISKLGVMGYYQPFFGEGTLNIQIPKIDFPFIICHEMAHQKGIAYEDEAHLMAVWLIQKNGSNEFKLSMYINMMDYLMPKVKRFSPAQYQKLEMDINPQVKEILIKRKEFWLKQRGLLDKITSFLFDKLLKINHQEQGIDSYENITNLLYQLYLNKKR